MKSQIEILLGEWGRWKRGENRTGLGYPSRSAFQQERVDGSGYLQAECFMVGDDVQRLDELIDFLHPEARAVVTAHYIRPGSVKTKLDFLRLSRTFYYSILDFSHGFLAHRLSEKAVIPLPYHCRQAKKSEQ